MLAIFALALAQSPDSAPYLQCVEKHAVRLEVSREEAGVVAEAAAAACDAERLAAATAMAGQKGTTYLRAASDMLEAQGRRAALLRVVSVRAARAR